MMGAFRPCSSPIAIAGNINLDIKTCSMPAGGGILADGETSVPGNLGKHRRGRGEYDRVRRSPGRRCSFLWLHRFGSLGRRLESALGRAGVVPHPSGA
jgi:hypothetical protein